MRRQPPVGAVGGAVTPSAAPNPWPAEVDSAAARPGSPEHGDRPILRGRALEQAAVAEVLSAAAAGRGGSLVVRGEPGMGVSALLEWAVAKAGRAVADGAVDGGADGDDSAVPGGFAVLRVAGDPAEAALPAAGLLQLVSALSRAEALAGAELDGAALAGAATRGEWEPACTDREPTCTDRELICTDRELTCTDREPTGTDRLRTAVRLTRSLHALARQRPVLCIVDAADRLDEPSLSALAFTARRGTEAPIAMLFGTREPVPDTLAGLPGLCLPELDPLSIDELLRDLGSPALAPLATVAAGNPGALVELAGSLTPGQRDGGEPLPSRLPADGAVRRAYQARVASLPPTSRQVLMIAAADQRLTADELIRAIDIAGIDLTALEPVEAAGLLAVDGPRVRLYPQLLRQIIYEDAAVASRRAVHDLIARCLAGTPAELRRELHAALAVAGPDDRRADRLERLTAAAVGDCELVAFALRRAAELTADHQTAARRRIHAARYLWLAGRPGEARELLRLGTADGLSPRLRGAAGMLAGEIELHAGDPTLARDQLLGAARDLDAGGDRRLRLTALALAGDALFHTGRENAFPDVAARALALRRPDEAPADELIFEYLTGMRAMLAPDFADAVAHLRRVVALAGLLDDGASLLRAGMAAIMLGDHATAYRFAVRARAQAQSRGERAAVPHAIWLLGVAQFARGRYHSASTLLQESLRLARATGQSALASEHVATLAVLAAIEGDREQALAWLHDLRTSTIEYDQGESGAISIWALALLDLIAGDAESTLRRLRRVVNGAAASGYVLARMAAVPYLVEAATWVGERDAAAGFLAHYVAWARVTGNPHLLALGERGQALLACDDVEAGRHFEQARRYHLKGGSDFERARTALLYGQRLRRGRRPGAARELLHEAHETFRHLDSPVWARLAAVELRAAGWQVAAPPAPYDRPEPATPFEQLLTEQELRIARLAAGGATNREIATRLYLSARTVEYHLSKTFAKLGIRSRVELTSRIG